MTLFTWEVVYAKAEEQSAPEVILNVFRNDELYGGDRMMYIDWQMEILVQYIYQDTLPTGSYRFEMFTFDDETGGNGPVVS